MGGSVHPRVCTRMVTTGNRFPKTCVAASSNHLKMTHLRFKGIILLPRGTTNDKSGTFGMMRKAGTTPPRACVTSCL